jgi:hypothetical protein
MMKGLLRNWGTARLLRLGLAVAFIAAGITGKEPIAWAIGAVFALQALLNIGCCGATCVPPETDRKAVADVEDVHYEEVK